MRSGEFIAKARKDAEITVTQLAEKVGVTRSHITKWETGSDMVGDKLAKRICDTLGLDYDIVHKEMQKERDEKRKARERAYNQSDDDKDEIYTIANATAMEGADKSGMRVELCLSPDIVRRLMAQAGSRNMDLSNMAEMIFDAGLKLLEVTR